MVISVYLLHSVRSYVSVLWVEVLAKWTFRFIVKFSERAGNLSPLFSYKAIVQDTSRMGVWLGWHSRYNATRESQVQLSENGNLSSSIRAKVALIYVAPVLLHNVNGTTGRCCSCGSGRLRLNGRPSDPLVYVCILYSS